MRAAVLAERGKAGLTVTDFAEPKPAAGEAVMKVHAASINHVDLYMRDSGAGISHELPLILGVDGAGEIAEAPASIYIHHANEDTGIDTGRMLALLNMQKY